MAAKITPPSFMKFCQAVPEICRGHVHVAKKERRIIIIIIIRNGAKTISLQTTPGRWSYRYMFLVGPKVFSFVVKGG
jgi:hypothetical protein